jgi:hypothetical protein
MSVRSPRTGPSESDEDSGWRDTGESAAVSWATARRCRVRPAARNLMPRVRPGGAGRKPWGRPGRRTVRAHPVDSDRIFPAGARRGCPPRPAPDAQSENGPAGRAVIDAGIWAFDEDIDVADVPRHDRGESERSRSVTPGQTPREGDLAALADAGDWRGSGGTSIGSQMNSPCAPAGGQRVRWTCINVHGWVVRGRSTNQPTV